MKKTFIILCLIAPMLLCAQNNNKEVTKEVYTRLPLGAVKPTGWLKEQMQKDVDGFVGHLDELVPTLIHDPIYSEGRLHKNSKLAELGNYRDDAGGDDQYKWWNSETQSNWRDGYLRNVLLLDDKNHTSRVDQYIQNMLNTQDKDGYIGIYAPDLRYTFKSENGELWAKATLYRALLGYYEYTQDAKVWEALVKAVDNVMLNYPINESDPFNVGTEFTGGVAHGLTFTDVLDRMYQLTGDRKYWDYALFLYMNYSNNFTTEKDVQLTSIFNKDYKLQSHGVHTYEHLRPLIVAAFASNDPMLSNALDLYLGKINTATTLSGGPIGDEWVGQRIADATQTGYEYCSIHELLDSYTVLLQKRGDAHIANIIENIFYNAAQGARDPNHSCIAYLKTDNSYEMTGPKNGKDDPNQKQTRYKYSPVHQEAAVCCVPNAGRITPYFLQAAWMKEDESTLVANLLMPNILAADINGSKIEITNTTDYPYKNQFELNVSVEKPTKLKLKIRKPNWATKVHSSEKYKIENNFIVFEKEFKDSDKIKLSFDANVKAEKDLKGEYYFTYGALVFAKPIDAKQEIDRVYTPDFVDYVYKPLDNNRYEYISNHNASYQNGEIELKLRNKESKKVESVRLIPIGKTVLRQAGF